MLRWLSVELTYQCQERCDWCYNPPGATRRPTLNENEWHGIIDQAADLGIEVVVFTGGEPLLVPGLVGLIDHASGRGLLTGLVTNGELLPKRLETLRQAGLGMVWITLLGPNAEMNDAITNRPGSFSAKMRALRALRGAAADGGMLTMANVVVERRNHEHVYEILEVLARHQIAVAFVEEAYGIGRGQARPDLMVNASERRVPIRQIADARRAFPEMRVVTRTFDRPFGVVPPTPSDFLNVTPDGFVTEVESGSPRPGDSLTFVTLHELATEWGRIGRDHT